MDVGVGIDDRRINAFEGTGSNDIFAVTIAFVDRLIELSILYRAL